MTGPSLDALLDFLIPDGDPAVIAENLAALGVDLESSSARVEKRVQAVLADLRENTPAREGQGGQNETA